MIASRSIPPLQVRVPPDMKARIQTLAKANGLTQNGQILALLTRAVAAEERRMEKSGKSN